VYRLKSLGGVLTYDGSYLTRLWDWADLLLLLSAVVALCLPYGSHAAQTAKVTTKGVDIHPTIGRMHSSIPDLAALHSHHKCTEQEMVGSVAGQVIRALRPVTLIPRVNGLMVVVNTLYQVRVTPETRLSKRLCCRRVWYLLTVTAMSELDPNRPFPSPSR
jgi:hypothetical protein